MQAVSQLVTISMDVPVGLSLCQNHEFLVNTFSAQFVLNTKVILPACVVETLPTDVEVILPARFQVNAVLKCNDAFATLEQVNDDVAFEWVNKSAILVWVNAYVQVNLASEWVNMFNTPVWVNPTTICANMLATCIWVNTCNHVNHIVKVSISHAQVVELVNYFIVFRCVNETVTDVWMIMSAHPWASKFMNYVPANGILMDIDLAEYNNCSMLEFDVQMKNPYNSKYLYSWFAMCLLSNQQDFPLFTEFQNVLWLAPTARYDVMDYPFFVFHQKQNFLNFHQTLKLYSHHLSKYWFVRIFEFSIHWCNHWYYFVLQNVTLLVNFDLTPHQQCRRTYLIMCRSLHYKHNFVVILSALTFSTNLVTVGFVKYVENILRLVFKCKYTYMMVVTPSYKYNFKNLNHNAFTFSTDSIPHKIGGGHHGMSVENLDMQFVSPYVISAPLDYSKFKKCKFVDHVEMSKALTQYDTSVYVLVNIPLHLLVSCLFHDRKTLIASQHNICISKRMSMSEITQKLKIHSEICKHQYVSVLQPYCKIMNTEEDLKDTEMDNNLDENDISTEHPANTDFPPTPADTSLRKK